jgi:GT2 family glycosyltransferase
LTDGETVARSDVVVRSYPQFGIHVEYADSKSISGWAYGADRSEPLALAVYSDGEFQSVVEASGSRFDVKSAFDLKSHQCGFAVVLKEAKSSAKRLVTLCDVETGIVLAEVSISNSYEYLTETVTSLRRGHEGADTTHLISVLAPLVIASRGETNVVVRKLPKQKATEVVDGVDVVIPIYGGSIETAECLESVLHATNITHSRVILINDCSPDPIINDLLDALEMRKLTNVIIVRRQKNMGFSAAVNLGMAIAADRHVVLLNADTVVQSGWIDRLMAAAKIDPMIGTVTPLSNNGEIVTLPYACRTMAVEDSLLARQVDQLAAEFNSSKIIDIPVAIGFCMFIRRECINEVGIFDADKWGRGYGEEVDFCLKARALGWRHVVATDTFVVHRGAVSFGDEKLKRIMESSQKISQLYPFYDQLIQRFIAEDPIRVARRKVNLALISRTVDEERVLHVSHSFGGGTEKYVRDIAAIQAQQGQVPLFLRFDADGNSKLEVNLEGTNLHGLFDERHTETFTAAASIFTRHSA